MLNNPNVHMVTIPKHEHKETPAVKLMPSDGNKIESIRHLNSLLAQKLGNLDKIQATEDKVKSFQPENPESETSLLIEDGNGNKFYTTNAQLIRQALDVFEHEVKRVRESTEAEIMQIAA